MIFKSTLTLVFNILLVQVLFAQKVQNVQESSIWATTPVKVDGKLNEETFEPSNKSTLLSYTMSNDDKNLYLVMKSDDNTNNNKIMMGGITLSINTDGKKKEKDGFAVTYPVLVRQQGQRGGGQRQGGQQGGFGQRMQGGSSDSAALVRRKQQLAAVKEIKVAGFKDITDSLISIYNEYEIVAVAKFDDQGAYIYELAIPLKLLGLTTSSKEFAYNIRVNGLQLGFGGGFGGGGQDGGFGGGQGGGGFGGGQRGGGGRGGFDPSAFLPTDFWGKYTLAKK